jgi:hypothetical protein
MHHAAHDIANADERLPFCPSQALAASNESGESQLRFLEPELSPDTSRVHPEVYVLSHVPWAVIGTLTWKDYWRRQDTANAASGRASDFNLLMTCTAARLRKRRKDLVIASTQEFHASGEVHWHFLIGRDGLEGVSAVEAARLMATLWTSDLHPFDSPAKGIGDAVIEPYNYTEFGRRGVDYLCKRQREPFGTPFPKNFIYSAALLKCFKTQPPSSFDEKSAISPSF